MIGPCDISYQFPFQNMSEIHLSSQFPLLPPLTRPLLFPELVTTSFYFVFLQIQFLLELSPTSHCPPLKASQCLCTALKIKSKLLTFHGHCWVFLNSLAMFSDVSVGVRLAPRPAQALCYWEPLLCCSFHQACFLPVSAQKYLIN